MSYIRKLERTFDKLTGRFQVRTQATPVQYFKMLRIRKKTAQGTLARSSTAKQPITNQPTNNQTTKQNRPATRTPKSQISSPAPAAAGRPSSSAWAQIPGEFHASVSGRELGLSTHTHNAKAAKGGGPLDRKGLRMINDRAVL